MCSAYARTHQQFYDKVMLSYVNNLRFKIQILVLVTKICFDEVLNHHSLVKIILKKHPC